MTWANEAYFGRLVAQETGENLIQFTDNDTGEAVNVFAPPSDLKLVYMTVTGKGAGTVSIGRPDAEHFVKGNTPETTRDVWHFVTKEHATALRAGLTVHRSFFSSAPHSFELSPELGFEEIFYFLTKGKAILEGEGLWPNGDEVDAAWSVRNGQFAQIPMGRHVVTGLPVHGRPPGVVYVWCYLCTKPEWEK